MGTALLTGCVQPNPGFVESGQGSTQSGAVRSDPPNPGGTLDFAAERQKGQWQALVVSTTGLSEPVASGYSLSVTLNHQALVQGGASAGGEDLAVVYVSNNQVRQIDAVLDPDSGWGRADTKIWFASQGSLAVNQSSADQYYLVRGSSSFRPKQNPSGVFALYDGFDGDQAAHRKRWTVSQSAQGSPIEQVSQGTLRMSVASGGAEPNFLLLASTQTLSGSGFSIAVRSRYAASADQPCSVVEPLLFRDAQSDRSFTGLAIVGRALRSLTRVNDQEQRDALSSPRNDDGAWKQYSLVWRAREMLIREGATTLSSTTNHNSVPTVQAQPLRVGLAVRANPGGCTGDKAAQLEVDWIRGRRVVSPEPTVALR